MEDESGQVVLAARKKLVSMDWIEACVEKGVVVDTKEHEV